MSDIIIEIIKWALPSIGAYLLAQLPSVRKWARANWTVSVVTMTMAASFSFMGIGFYTYNVLIRPYFVLCETANQCISVKRTELQKLKDTSTLAIQNLKLIYTAPNDGARNLYINEGNKFANETDVIINDVYRKVVDGNVK